MPASFENLLPARFLIRGPFKVEIFGRNFGIVGWVVHDLPVVVPQRVSVCIGSICFSLWVSLSVLRIIIGYMTSLISEICTCSKIIKLLWNFLMKKRFIFMLSTLINSLRGHATAQMVSRWFLTEEAVVRFQASPCGICDEQLGKGTEVTLGTSVFPVHVIPRILHIN
jgi:hypothetical protein